MTGAGAGTVVDAVVGADAGSVEKIESARGLAEAAGDAMTAGAGGGSIAGADLSRLNLAALVADGERIAVPLVGQPPPAVDPSAVVGGTSSPSDGTDGSGSSAHTAEVPAARRSQDEHQQNINAPAGAPWERESSKKCGTEA